MNNQNKTELYSETLVKLCDFLKNAGIKKIVFHQFDFLIMYFPVYMLIKDLESPDLQIEFKKEKDSDREINIEMARDNFESLDLDTLRIGLCEPVVFNVALKRRTCAAAENQFKDYQRLVGKFKLGNECVFQGNSYFLHLPFIKFPPLYGVSLIESKTIQDIKKKKSKEGKKSGGKRVLSIEHYRKHFSAKLGIFDKDDFETLTASSYPDGSTADWFIRKFPGNKNSIENLEDEFEMLLNNKVDVAFTVQPWAAVPLSKKIDIVFKNVCDEKFDCTSLIFKTNKPEYLILGDYILNCFNKLLDEKINKLYVMHYSTDIDESIKYYCKLLSDHWKRMHAEHTHTAHSEKDPCCECYVSDCKNQNGIDVKIEEGCLFENKMALRLNADSQIYKQLKSIEEEGTDAGEAVANYFVEKFGNTPEGHNKFQELMQMENKS